MSVLGSTNETIKSLRPSEFQVATSARTKSVMNFSCDSLRSCVPEKSLQLPAVFWGWLQCSPEAADTCVKLLFSVGTSQVILSKIKLPWLPIKYGDNIITSSFPPIANPCTTLILASSFSNTYCHPSLSHLHVWGLTVLKVWAVKSCQLLKHLHSLVSYIYQHCKYSSVSVSFIPDNVFSSVTVEITQLRLL